MIRIVTIWLDVSTVTLHGQKQCGYRLHRLVCCPVTRSWVVIETESARYARIIGSNNSTAGGGSPGHALEAVVELRSVKLDAGTPDVDARV